VRKPKPSPKLCERCEAFFPSIASETCPQCFAPLTSLTEEEAIKAAEYQLERLKDPEYVELKAEDDERFKEQSFGACLTVVGLTLAVAIISLILITVTARHQGHLPQEIKPPVSGGSLIEINPISSDYSFLPHSIGGLSRGVVIALTQTGSNTPIFHCNYGDDIQIFVLPTLSVSQNALSGFRLVISAICSQTNPPLISQEVHFKNGYYDIIGSNGGLVGDTAQKLVDASSKQPSYLKR
jgi:hypothetical protein